jgi:hypothetical protein
MLMMAQENAIIDNRETLEYFIRISTTRFPEKNEQFSGGLYIQPVVPHTANRISIQQRSHQ